MRPTLTDAKDELSRLERLSEDEVVALTLAFKNLAGHADAILKQAASIVGCAEDENMRTVLSTVQSLCVAAGHHGEQRMKAAGEILEIIKQEEDLLKKLTSITHRQEAVASHLKALSVITNIEVTNLGSAGATFRHLALELSAFSKSVSNQTLELASRTDDRNQTIDRSRSELVGNLASLRARMSHMDQDITRTLEVTDAGLSQLARIPSQFRMALEETARKIAGVVAAIQSHDITRQQVEHVQHSLDLIVSAEAGIDSGEHEVIPTSYAGLTMQVGQLRRIRETVAGWILQAKTCMSDIQQLSTSEVVSVGPHVLQQERELSTQLSQVELLQKESQEYGEKIQQTLGGLTSLLDLVNEHMEKSIKVQDNLRMLMFNSLLEAGRLGAKGAVVTVIANMIKGVSGEWSAITEESRYVVNQILEQVHQSNELIEVFSESRSAQLHDEQEETKSVLNKLRQTAAFVAEGSSRMQATTTRMQMDIAASDAGIHLDSCLSHLDAAAGRIQSLTDQIEKQYPDVAKSYEAAEVELMFSTLYTTEVERDVARFVLYGTPMPACQESVAGNDVELF